MDTQQREIKTLKVMIVFMARAGTQPSLSESGSTQLSDHEQHDENKDLGVD